MTLHEYLERKPRGFRKEMAWHLGFSVQHIKNVLARRSTASPFFVECIKKYAPEINSTDDLIVTNGKPSAKPRISYVRGKYQVMHGKKYIGKFASEQDALIAANNQMVRG